MNKAKKKIKKKELNMEASKEKTKYQKQLQFNNKYLYNRILFQKNFFFCRLFLENLPLNKNTELSVFKKIKIILYKLQNR